MKLIDATIADERQAPIDYTKLSKTMRSKQSRREIARIKKDEIRHLKIVKKIKKREAKFRRNK